MRKTTRLLMLALSVLERKTNEPEKELSDMKREPSDVKRTTSGLERNMSDVERKMSDLPRLSGKGGVSVMSCGKPSAA
jgi:hypothetical protein